MWRPYRAFIVVLAPVTQIPPELDKFFVCVDHDLPDYAQLEEIARGVATQDGELPNPDDLPRVFDATSATDPAASSCSPLPAAASPSSQRPSAMRPAGPRLSSMSAPCLARSSASQRATSAWP